MMKSHLNFLSKIFLFSILVKIVCAFFIPIVGDESYYWIWGQNLQLSYFDHPPAVAWLTWISDILYKFFPAPLMGLSLRLPFIIISSLTFLIWVKNYFLEQKHSSAIYYFAVLYFLNPLLGIGGIFATPDVPLLLFWSLSYYAVLQIRKTQGTQWYAFLGVFLGLGFCAKYHIVLFPITMIVSLALLKELKIIQLKKLIFTFVFGLIFSAPVIIWNSQNDWASFAFQLNHGFNDHRAFNWSWTITYLTAQVLMANPIFIFFLFKKIRSSLTKNMALTQWGFFLFSSFNALVEANWPVASHTQGLIAINKEFKSYFKSSLVFGLSLWFLIGILFLTPFGTQKFNRLPQSFAADEIYHLTKDYRPLYGPTYQMSSLLQLVSHENINKLREMARIDFYDTLESSLPVENQFFTLKYSHMDWPSWMKEYKIEPVLDIEKYNLSLYKVSRE